MPFLRIEQETQINFNAEEKEATLYTADPVMIRKMDKIVEQNPEQFKSEVHSRYQGKIYGMIYSFPKNLVVIRTREITRNLTEEQRRKMGERMKQYNESKRPIEEKNCIK